MLAKPKQIIVDKDALVGINIGDLCDFARNHFLLCSDTLLYECATTSESERKNMLSRCDRLIKAGAYYCSCSIAFIQSEGENCLPYPWFLPDLEATEQIRTGEACLEDVLHSPKIKQAFDSRCKVSKSVFVDLSAKLKNRIDLENPDVGKKIKELSSDRFGRFKALLESIDARDLHQMCVDSFPHDWIKNEREFCLSPEWMSWQLIRLTDAIVQNYYYLRQTGPMPRDENERAEHDYQDMEYVLLLNRADGVLTRDKKLVEPLARAAFPEKDVFSNLDDVPDDYVCNWA
ncbi:MAG TPA: hypothetical protein VMW24_23975 [Sedimentisphaerales bacterium]|nr:hypothetical protein [Sedimentisphaerales bacterium]